MIGSDIAKRAGGATGLHDRAVQCPAIHHIPGVRCGGEGEAAAGIHRLRAIRADRPMEPADGVMVKEVVPMA